MAQTTTSSATHHIVQTAAEEPTHWLLGSGPVMRLGEPAHELDPDEVDAPAGIADGEYRIVGQTDDEVYLVTVGSREDRIFN